MWSTTKIASIFIVFGLSAISGIFPCFTVKCLVSKLGKSEKFKRALGLMNCFAGGVFFATCILDIVPESREDMEEAKEHLDWDTHYALTELLVGIGLLMILTLEHGAHACFQSSNSESESTGHQRAVKAKVTLTAYENKTAAVYSDSQVNHEPRDHTKKDDIIIKGKDNSCFDEVTYETDKTGVRLDTSSTCPRTKSDAEIICENRDKTVIKYDEVIPSEEVVTTPVSLETLLKPEAKRTNLGGLVLLIALSVHMIFEGVSLGLLKDARKVWDLLLALSIHKVLVFFTLGLQTLELLKSVRKTIFVVCIIASVTPIGIVIGESINYSSEPSTQTIASAILQGIAAGTFLYITFFEILQREFEAASGHDLLKVFCTIIGFGVIGASQLLGHGHGDEYDGHGHGDEHE